MDGSILLIFAAILLVGGLITGAVFAVHQTRQRRLTRMRDLFFLRREWLEAGFLSKASKSGKPRGLEWVDCEFASDVTFARDRTNGQLRALVGVTHPL